MAIKDYLKEYSKLNDQQRSAVDYIDGPLMVIAGPGTGKTQLLSLRVANILDKTDINEENILCLTFSDSGSRSMRDRLLRLIGTSSDRITVSTFHAFSNEIISQNIDNQYLGYRSINTLRAKKIISTIQSSLGYKNSLNEQYYTDSILRTISDSKRANLSYSKIARIANDNILSITKCEKLLAEYSPNIMRVSKKAIKHFISLYQELNKIDNVSDNDILTIATEALGNAISDFNTTNKTKKLSIWKSDYLEKNDQDFNYSLRSLKVNQKLLDFSDIYKTYQDILKKDKLYDYDDMIINAINLMKSIPSIKYSLQERYQYILIDEFQDSNDSQIELVKLLGDNPVLENKPNIMVVGDDDQSIYSFQGAKYSHMLDFINSYDNVKVIVLEKNYRSSSYVIDFSQKISNQITNRLINELPELNKEFKIANLEQNKNSSVRRTQFNSEVSQVNWIIERLKSKNRENSNQSVAILATKHEYLSALASLLIEEKIAFNYDFYENIIKTKEFNEIYLIAKTILSIQSNNKAAIDYYLSQILSLDFLGMDEQTLWKISIQSYENRVNWIDTTLNDKNLNNFIRALIKLGHSLKLYNFDQILDLILGISDLKLSNNETFQSKYISNYRQKDKSGFKLIELLSNLDYLKKQFIEYIPNKSSQHESLEYFIDFIDDLKNSNEKINNIIRYQNNSNIHLMSVFKSKGLEFDEIILINFADNYWGRSLRFDSSNIALPVNLKYIRNNDEISDDYKLRLLYVAITRARKNIILSGIDQDLNGKQLNFVNYLNENIDNHQIIESPFLGQKFSKVEQISNNKLEPDTFIGLRKGSIAQSITKNELDEAILDRINEYQLSPTGLNDFIDIVNKGPEYFYIRHIMKYPQSLKSNYVSYGNAIHASLEWLQNNLNIQKKLPSFKELIKRFKNDLKNQLLEGNDYSYYLDKGRQALNNYYETKNQEFKAGDISEFNFKSLDLKLEDSKITGKIDRIILDDLDRTIEIVDYKSTKYSNLSKSSIKDQGYIRQLYFVSLKLFALL